MNTPQPSVAAARIIEVLRGLNGIPTKVTLKDGRELSVHNIAWGQDMADPEYHITTNISPAPQLPHVIDVFSTGDVASIADPQTGKVHFDRLPSNTSLERTRVG
ncbi:hypothetical protein [Dokdonella sp.]|uniref:hypothetical protein n=1 Tax=Dokdonella sp. TaxID=2291710 RepID=UPI002C7D96E0|nr:hypothetical protein [Dokdonella sp.]HPH70193.1 hypothetical protein [Kofleriaceae bacterium]HPN78822.1 hypothetical protein [Dokdonella sp.]